jgi:hypothetical protein
MRAMFVIVFMVIVLALTGCYEQKDARVNLGADVRSNTLGNNVITKPISDLVNHLIGKGIVVNEVKMMRNPTGFLMVQVRGFNESVAKRVFEYKAEWLNDDGFTLDTITDNWMRMSVSPSSEFTFTVVATRREASDFRINTRVDNKTK